MLNFCCNNVPKSTSRAIMEFYIMTFWHSFKWSWLFEVLLLMSHLFTCWTRLYSYLSHWLLLAEVNDRGTGAWCGMCLGLIVKTSEPIIICCLYSWLWVYILILVWMFLSVGFKQVDDSYMFLLFIITILYELFSFCII